jgi:hypothetical protein
MYIFFNKNGNQHLKIIFSSWMKQYDNIYFQITRKAEHILVKGKKLPQTYSSKKFPHYSKQFFSPML